MNEKYHSFEEYTITEWQNLVESTLKGRSIQDLALNTYEGISLQPLYTERPVASDLHPSRWWNSKSDWKIAQQVTASSTEKVIDYAVEELEKGSEVIAIKEDGNDAWTHDQIQTLLSRQQTPHLFLMNESIVQKWTPHLLKMKEQFALQGVFGYDMISGEASKGALLTESVLENWVSQINELSHAHPILKTIIISTIPYHQAGANAVQELACALAEAAWVINHLAQEGWKVEQIVDKMHIQFAAGSSFFLEVAKIRAFRALWSHFIECYGVGSLTVSVGSESSSFNKTVQDPHVNLLRAGNEAFAAALGGVDYQHVEPYNSTIDLPTPLAIRAARNIQLILKEEAFLKGISDPGGGSYYIETLTKELSEKSWDFFVKIEEKGGVQEGLAEGWIQQEIDEVWRKRVQDSATRTNTIVGTNRYASIEKIIMQMQDHPSSEFSIQPLNKRASSEEWDKLIYTLQHHKQHTLQTVDLICLGDLKDYKPRMDFIQGILNTIGLKYEVKNAVGHSPVQIICGKDTEYSQNLDELLKDRKTNQFIYLTGKPVSEEWKNWNDKGLTDSIHDGKNIIKLLTTLVKQLEEVNANEADV